MIYLTPQLNDQTIVTFFTDTGGGWNAISKQLSDKYQWPVTDRNTENGIIQVTDMPNFDASASVPKAGLNNWWAGKMQVVPKNDLSHQKELAYAASALQPASSSEVDIQTLVEKINKDTVVRFDSASKWIQASPKVTHLVEEHRQHLYEKGTTVTGFDCDRDGRADDAEKCLFLYRQLVRYIEQH